MGGQIVVQERLERGHRQRPWRPLDQHRTGVRARLEREGLHILRQRGRDGLGHRNLCAVRAEKAAGRIEDIDGVHAKQRAVNPLNDNALIMHVDDLGKHVARRMGLALFGGQRGLDFFPIGLGGRHGMVAVTDCIRQHRAAVGNAVFGVEYGAVAELCKRVQQCVGLRALRNKPAGQMPAPLHQFHII